MIVYGTSFFFNDMWPRRNGTVVEVFIARVEWFVLVAHLYRLAKLIHQMSPFPTNKGHTKFTTVDAG